MKRCLHCNRPRTPKMVGGRMRQPRGLWCDPCTGKGQARARRNAKKVFLEWECYSDLDYPGYLKALREELEAREAAA